MRSLLALGLSVLAAGISTGRCTANAFAGDGNRLAYLDENNPWYPHLNFPKLITPQWVGEEGVECVVILAIDDMRDPAKYEAYLRPILNRLKQIDGRAPVSIMTCNVKPDDPQLKQWLDEGLSLEAHTVDHPCPLLCDGNLNKAKSTYNRCVDLLNQIPGNTPVAFRMPCCDSLNTVSPRFYAEIFDRHTPAKNFLGVSSSVFNIFTSDDPAIPRGLVQDADGRDKFLKYIPQSLKRGDATFNTFVNTIQNYPYPYVINRQDSGPFIAPHRPCWEFPCVVPSDWEAQHLQKPNNPDTLRDMKAALDITVLKQGVFCLVFHPHGWIKHEQIVDLIDHAVAKHGKQVKFLSFREAYERLNANLLQRKNQLQNLSARSHEFGCTFVLDVNNDGFLDVVFESHPHNGEGLPDIMTRLWSAQDNNWREAELLKETTLSGAKFGVFQENGNASLLIFKVGPAANAFPNDASCDLGHFNGTKWQLDAAVRIAAKDETEDAFHFDGSRSRLIDIDRDGVCELVVGNTAFRAIYRFDTQTKTWRRLPFDLPDETVFSDDYEFNRSWPDAGLRFVDIDEDGFNDVIVSNPKRYGIWLFDTMQAGWSRKVMERKFGSQDQWKVREAQNGKNADDGKRERIPRPSDRPDLPLIIRANGSDNGFFVHSRHLFWQNEDTDKLPDLVDRRSFNELLAQANLPPRPKSTVGAMKSFQTRPGFAVQLAAAEPLVMDPVAFEWGADGKLWVVEMADYPLGTTPPGAAAAKGEAAKGENIAGGGRVRFLEDADRDGVYEKSTLFLDGIPFPTGVLPWRNGVLITSAPNILYAEDTDGDGRADKQEVLYSGFVEGNQQHRVNGLVYGLDNWVYCANGDSGGAIKSLKTSQSVNISGRDVRIRPDTGEVEAVAGQTQFGRNRDDWGNWFGCNNSNPMYQYVLDEHYQRRNPHFSAPPSRRDVPKVAGNAPVFPISQTLERFNDIHTLNRFTSACSAMIYRDNLFGPHFAGNMFVSEPVHNLVHREVVGVQPAGCATGFTSERAPDEQQSEFLASTDNWFRPTMIKTGPDGALWIADMYRHVIEHPQWIPDTWQKRLDLRAGHDKARIYRVLPVHVKPRPFRRFDTLSIAELVAALDSPSGWQRDTAQRLLIERCTPLNVQERAAREAVPLLAAQAAASANPLCRLHSLCVLDGMSALTEPILLKALSDDHPGVRRHAVRLSEPLVSVDNANEKPSVLLIEALLKLSADTDPHVRLQLAYTLGEVPDPRAGAALGRLLASVDSDPYLFAAGMSSVRKENVEHVLAGALAHAANGAPNLNLMDGLLSMAAALGNDWALLTLLTDITRPRSGAYAKWQLAAVGGLLDTLDRQGKPLSKLHDAPDAAWQAALQQLSALFAAARTMAVDGRLDDAGRTAAIRLLGRGPSSQESDRGLLASLLTPQSAPAIQESAVTALGRLNSPAVAELLLENWRGFGAARRSQVLDVLLSREEWLKQLLTAVEARDLATTDFDAARRQRLLDHKTEAIRTRAARLFAESMNADRQQVIERYRPALDAPGNAVRGAELFVKTCAPCHKLKDIGFEVGPDLASLTDKSPESLLVALLDPNRAVEAKFLNFAAVTKGGLSFNGMLAAETGNSITLRGPGGKEQTILREDLDELISTSKSTMPEGLEKDLRPDDVADIIAHVRANVPLPQRKTFEGNQPATVTAAADGSLRLTVAACEIYGTTLVLEKQYGKLGWWSSLDDQAVWTADVPQAGKYTVEFDYACDRSVAEINPWRFDAGSKSISGKVPSTGNWDTYRQLSLGEIELVAGKQRLVLRPAKRIQGALLDLRGIRLAPIK